MTNPAEQAAPQPEVDREDVHQGDEFDQPLPIVTASDDYPVTHVARMRGDQIEFSDALSAFVNSGSEASDPLRHPIETSSTDALADLLNRLGGATVVSIDPL